MSFDPHPVTDPHRLTTSQISLIHDEANIGRCFIRHFTLYNVKSLENRAVLKRVPSAERSVMRSVLQHTKTRAAYACGASHRALNQMDDFVAV